MSKVTWSFISHATFQETSWKLALELKVKTLFLFCQCDKKTNKVCCIIFIFERKQQRDSKVSRDAQVHKLSYKM